MNLNKTNSQKLIRKYEKSLNALNESSADYYEHFIQAMAYGRILYKRGYKAFVDVLAMQIIGCKFNFTLEV